MLIKQARPFESGYTAITYMDAKENSSLMDFGILMLKSGQQEVSSEDTERAFLLIKGEVAFEWEGNKKVVKRESFLEESPTCLSVPSSVTVTISGLGEDSEIAVIKTENQTKFIPKFYTDEECRDEIRGKGTMNETSTRVVRTVFDYSNAPFSNLVVGEVINFPGKWSSFPPHHHTQPEIYYYKFQPENGYGISEIGDDLVKVKNNDTAVILDSRTHPQTSAPGYAMYYLWIIRHLEGDPYITPTYEPEHIWVASPEAKIFPDK